MARASKPLVRLREQAQLGSIPTRLRHNQSHQSAIHRLIRSRLFFIINFRTNVRTAAVHTDFGQGSHRKSGPQIMINFQTSPEQYKHWKLACDGDVARLTIDVQEDETLADGYTLTLNSYE